MISRTLAAIRLEAQTNAVLERHERAILIGADAVALDYDKSSIVFGHDRVYLGPEGVRSFFADFLATTSAEFWKVFTVIDKHVEGEYVYITWKAAPWVLAGTDTLVIREDKIVMQTFYTYPAILVP